MEGGRQPSHKNTKSTFVVKRVDEDMWVDFSKQGLFYQCCMTNGLMSPTCIPTSLSPQSIAWSYNILSYVLGACIIQVGSPSFIGSIQRDWLLKNMLLAILW
jgi:hypothetical protein